MNEPMFTRRWHGLVSTGFTMVELLATVAILLVVAGLLARGLSRIRATARLSESAANVRSLGSLLAMYAADNRDMPPVFLGMQEGYWPPEHPPKSTVRGVEVAGFWFDHTSLYHLAFDHPVPPKILRIPGVPWTSAVADGPDGLVGLASSYSLTAVMYADPAYWTRDGTQSPRQWTAQKLGSIVSPSSKGLIYQAAAGSASGATPVSTEMPGVLSAVLWADQSGSLLEQSKLHRGVPNFFDHYGRNPETTARPIATTEWGVRGRDR